MEKFLRKVHADAAIQQSHKQQLSDRSSGSGGKPEMATQASAPTSSSTDGQIPQSSTPKLLTDADFGPGNFEDLHKKCKDVFPTPFEGAKFMLQKGLNQHFQVTHTLSMSPINNSYRFGATYVGTKQITSQESYPVLLADTDVRGNVTATMLHHFTDRIRGKFAAQVQNSKIAAAQTTLEWRGRLANCGLTIANPDLVNETGVFVGHYLRRVAKGLDVGLELLYQTSRQLPGRQISALSYAARYTGEQFVASGVIGKTGLHLCYYHKQQEHFQVGVEWETNLRLQESTASLAYQLELPKADVLFRASVDTQWTVGAVLEKKLPPLPFTLAVSGMVNHAKNQSKFGIGLIVG